MKTRTAIVKSFKDEMTGELGYALKGMNLGSEMVNASMGQGIAHDLLEHVNGPGEIGGINDEMEALGAIWYVRGQFGKLNSKGYGSIYTAEQSLASDVTRMFRDYVDGGQYVSLDSRSTRRLNDRDAENSLQQVLRDADASYMGEIEAEDKSRAECAWPAYRAECLNRMRTGWRKAARKYPIAGEVNDLFWQIERVIDKAGKPEAAGFEYVLAYGPRGVYFEENYGDDYS
jgi:hypothetical protein